VIQKTSERILEAATLAFATRGYDAVSLDALAGDLGVSKQTILYWFDSKEALMAAVIKQGAGELSLALEAALDTEAQGFARVELVVRSVFRLAAGRPELLGLLREVARLGPPPVAQMTQALDPLVQRASGFLADEMNAGRMRRSDPKLLLLAMYSTVIGMVTEVEVMRALGEETDGRSLVRRRRDVLELLRNALSVDA
jgi:AcrR family transcriptional regulator